MRYNNFSMKFSIKVANYIFQQNLKTDANNVVISPLSMTIVLNIIALGSKGATLKQLLDLVGCIDMEEFSEAVSILADVLISRSVKGPVMSSANALWVDQRFQLKKSFQEIVRNLHEAEVMAVDFNKWDEVVKKANLWAEKQSNGLIKKILSPDTHMKDKAMILANALYFKGTWVEKFKPNNTKDQEFYKLDGEKVQVRFMNMFSEKFDYGTFEGCQVLRMSYNGEKARIFSMYIILPEEKDGLPNLLAKKKMQSIMFMENIKLDYKTINNLAIPKFKFDCKFSLKETMKELGLTLPFDEKSEDISEIIESPDWLYVDEIIQKSYVEVDEEGTEAAAVHFYDMTCGCAFPREPPPPINFIADHPFMFLIREYYTGAILFMGTVLDP